MPPEKQEVPLPKKEEAKTEAVPHIQCPRCDWFTDQKEGHIVRDGKVVKCPFIDMEITHLPQA